MRTPCIFNVGDFVYQNNLADKNVGYVVEVDVQNESHRLVDMRVKTLADTYVYGFSYHWNSLEDRYEMYRARWQNFRTALLNISTVQLLDETEKRIKGKSHDVAQMGYIMNLLRSI